MVLCEECKKSIKKDENRVIKNCRIKSYNHATCIGKSKKSPHYICTRNKGHKGLHHAHGGFDCYERW